MSNFYVIDDAVIVNFIVAENKETAETITGKTCIEQPLESPFPNIGWSYVDGVFSAPVE
jgi:hypothetical protein